MSSKIAETAVISTMILSVILLFCLVCMIGGFFIWWLWPIAIPAFFPGLVASGVLAAKVTFWQAVAFSWLLGIMFGKVKHTKKGE